MDSSGTNPRAGAVRKSRFTEAQIMAVLQKAEDAVGCAIYWFTSLADARRTVERWRVEYNEIRPHGSIGKRAPAEYYAEVINVASRACGTSALDLTHGRGETPIIDNCGLT